MMRIRFRKDLAFFSLSFIIPALIRWIPQAQFPYPIGYDTPLYLANAIAYSQTLNPFPLLYFILGLLYRFGIDPIISMKLIPALLYGFLGLSSFFFGRRLLKWSNWKSFVLVLFVALSPAMLRASWDLNKQALALVFLVAALSLSGDLRSTKNRSIFLLLCGLVAISHQLVFGLMLATLSLMLLHRLYRMSKDSSLRNEVVTLGLALAVPALLFLGFWYRGNLEGVAQEAVVATNGAGNIWPVAFSELFVYYYLLLVPLAVVGLFFEPAALAWLLAAAVGSFSVLLPLHIAVSVPDRWMILLAFPIAVLAANSVSRLKLNPPSPVKAVITVLLLVVVTAPSLSLLGLVGWPGWIQGPAGYVPGTMVSSSVPLKDIGATRQLVDQVDSGKQLTLVTEDAYGGWVRYYGPTIKVITWADWNPAVDNAGAAVNYARTKQEGTIYLLWYDDAMASSLGFHRIAQSDTLSLYASSG